MKRRYHIGYYLFLLLMTILIVASSYVRITQPTSDIPELLFCVNYGLENSDFTPLFVGIMYSLPFVLIIFTFLVFLLTIEKIGKYEKQNKFLMHFIIKQKRYNILLVILTLIICLYNLHFHTFVINNFVKSNFIKENYVDPRNVEITSTDKRNLVVIFLESFESTLLHKDQGGMWDNHIISEIEALNELDDVITFKNKGYIGMNEIPAATYTTAGVFTNLSAVPFKYDPTKRLTKDDFMKGAYNLGDFLKDNGYQNELISSATTSFGGIKELFTNHGSYDIIDINTYEKYDLKITDDDLGPWGFNDNYLFEAAKKRLEVLSKEDQPFNLTLIGIDSHFPTGFTGKYSYTKYKNNMANAYKTDAILVSNFINWIRNQEFYSNTTIVILGDHLSMANSFYRNKKERNIYISYINPAKELTSKENRIYTPLDTYPTILASLGYEIEGNRIGLGTNLFSEEKTLAEKYGLEELRKNIDKKSVFYNKEIMVK